MDTQKLSIDFPEALYKKLKMVTSAQGCSIRAYIIGHMKHIIERDMRKIFEKGSNEYHFVDDD